MSTLAVPLCNRCGMRPRMVDEKSRMKMTCEECYGTCKRCGGPAALMKTGYYRPHCKACRQATEPARETCSKCGKVRDGGHRSYCRACDQAYEANRRRTKHSAMAAKDRRRALMRHYGMTIDDYDALLRAQGGGCAGCGATHSILKIGTGQSDRGARGNLHVDHCHETGAIRGILCAACNATLGRVKDNPATLRALADYLERSLKLPSAA